jgi:hypothetical protein
LLVAAASHEEQAGARMIEELREGLDEGPETFVPMKEPYSQYWAG